MEYSCYSRGVWNTLMVTASGKTAWPGGSTGEEIKSFFCHLRPALSITQLATTIAVFRVHVSISGNIMKSPASPSFVSLKKVVDRDLPVAAPRVSCLQGKPWHTRFDFCVCVKKLKAGGADFQEPFLWVLVWKARATVSVRSLSSEHALGWSYSTMMRNMR